MEISALWRYPVKSMVGELLTRTDVLVHGMVGDRVWAVRDEVRGGIRGAKKIAELMLLHARTVTNEVVEVTLTDGSTVRSNDPDVHTRISAALGHEVTLWPLQPAGDLDHYRRGSPDSADVMVEVRQIFGREDDEPLPDFSVFPPEIMEFESPPGTYYDVFPLLVVTTASMESLSAMLPDSVVDVRRFRPNIVVAGAEPGFPELSWTGRRARLGGAVLRFETPCPRCVMVTRPTGDLPGDRQVLRTIVRDLDQCFGTYAVVEKPGSVSVGDEIEFLP
jgi:uncharacterized protein